MWITRHHGFVQEWLAPATETSALCPHLDINCTPVEYVFVHEHVDRVVERVAQTVRTHAPTTLHGDDIHVLSAVHDAEGKRFVQRVRATAGADARNLLCADTLVDLDDVLHRQPPPTHLAAVALTTIRFDEPQQLVVAMRDGRVLWTAWTVEEPHLSVERVEARTLRLCVKRTVLLCDRHAPTLAAHELPRIRRALRPLAAKLPADLLDHIAHLAHTRPDALTPRAFHRGAAAGVLNYATARLLRLAQLRRLDEAPSLRRFYEMSPAARATHYRLLRRVFRERRTLFDLPANDRRLRSHA